MLSHGSLRKETFNVAGSRAHIASTWPRTSSKAVPAEPEVAASTATIRIIARRTGLISSGAPDVTATLPSPLSLWVPSRSGGAACMLISIELRLLIISFDVNDTALGRQGSNPLLIL